MSAAAIATALDAAGATPLWQQTADRLAREIALGEIALGERLPSEREFGERLGISRVTLRKALSRLEAEGLISAVHGRGWFVGAASAARAEWPNSLESFSETAERMGLVATSIVRRAEVSPATLDEAEELHLVAGMPLFRLDRTRLLGGVPIARDRSHLPAGLVPGIESRDFTTESLYAVLASAGHALARADTTIEARAADDILAGELGLEAGRPVLVLRELVHDVENRPVVASDISYSGERYRLRTAFTRTHPRRTP